MALRIALLLAMLVAVAAQGATCEEDEAGLLQKTSVESLKVAKANSSVACVCSPVCAPPSCGCTYNANQYCDVNGAQIACPPSGLCKDASPGPATPAPTPATCKGENCWQCEEFLSETVPAQCPQDVRGASNALINRDKTCVYNPDCVTGAVSLNCFEQTGCQYTSVPATPAPTPATAPWSVVQVGGESNWICVAARNWYQDFGDGALETFVSGVCHTDSAGSAISTCSDDGKILKQQFFMNPNCEGQPQTDFVLTQNHCSEDASGMHYAYFCRPASA
jgi:hypothetical protein